MRRIARVLPALLLIAGVGCPGGGDPPKTFSYNLGGVFAPGDVIPGFLLKVPTGGRADLRAAGTWSNGTWTVMFTRTLAGTNGGTDDVVFDLTNAAYTYPFSVAVLDNMGGAFDATMSNQHFGVFTMGNESSTANFKAKSVATAPKANSNDTNWGTAWTKPAGAGISGTAAGAAVTLRAAYDATNVYLLAVWSDSTKDDLKQSWVFDGTTWTQRKDKGNDGSWATRDADGSQWDEDRLAIWWNMSNSAGVPNTGGVSDFTTGGCQVLCHDHRMGTHNNTEKADLWHWKAARTNPLGYADDQRLQDTTQDGHAMAARKDDTGTGIDSSNKTGSLPTYMSELDPGANARYLFDSSVPIAYRATAGLSGTFGANAQIARYTLQPPTGGRADIRAVGTWENDQWRVLFTRALTTTSSTEDRWFDGLAGGTLYYFSVAVLDNMGGTANPPDGTMLGQSAGVLTMGDETLQPTANLRARKGTSAPSRDPNDPKWGPSMLKPAGTGITGTATGAAATLRAAYDSTNFYLLAIWSDSTKNDLKQSWVWNGSAWAARSDKGTDGSWATIDADGSQWDEDRIAIWWDIGVTTGWTGSFATKGCQTLCHDHRMGSHVSTETADLWHWKATRTNPMGYADDQRLQSTTQDGHTMAARKDDTGTGVETNNGSGPPTSMADDDPTNATASYARFLFTSSTPSGPNPRKAVAFVNSVPTKTYTDVPLTGGTSGQVSYSTQINPLFASNCACHRNGNSQNGLNLDTYANLIKGGNNGSEVVAGNGAGSLLYKKVSMDSPPVGARMPFGGPYLSSAQQQTIKDWIDQGALNN